MRSYGWRLRGLVIGGWSTGILEVFTTLGVSFEVLSIGSDSLLFNKDLDARLLNLQRAGSNLAEMKVCLPVYTQFADESWFERYRELFPRSSKGKISPVAFALDDQPEAYEKKGIEYPIPRFEDALSEWLEPFRIKDS